MIKTLLKKATIWIILITIGVYIWQSLTINSQFNNPTNLAIDGGQVGYLIKEGQFWRLFTSIFLHAGIGHLAGNMIALLYNLRLEQLIGKIRFILIYLISGIIGNIISLFLLPNNVVSVGASGAVFGIMGAWIPLIWITRKTSLNKEINKIAKSMVIVIFLNLLMNLSQTETNIFAHAGGLMGGILTIILFGTPNKMFNNFSLFSKFIAGFIIVFIILGLPIFYFIA
jgi:rhomboid protease GluP